LYNFWAIDGRDVKMATLESTTAADLLKIREWIAADPWHQKDPTWIPEGLLTGNGVLAFCVADEVGPLCFVRLNAEGDVLRLATQFGPESEVSKKRLIVGLLSTGIPAIIEFGKSKGYKGIVFESVSQNLINFMRHQGFFKAAGENDYMLTFEEPKHV
jgi:hypothetical protein